MSPVQVLLVHGAATTAGTWTEVIGHLGAVDVLAVQRGYSGDLGRELAALAPVAEGNLLVGVSGGATLGLALAATRVRLAGAILHEPAVGSLLPGLLAPMAAAFAEGGTAGFARTLYGRHWREEMGPRDQGAVARELPMFRSFEPEPPRPGQGPLLTTVGSQSPPARHRAAAALHERFGLPVRVIPDCGHFVQRENPAGLAELILDRLSRSGTTRSD